MGWSYEHRPKGQSHLDFFREKFNPDCTVLDAAMGTPKEVYVALERPHGDVVPYIFLINWVPNDYHNFGYNGFPAECEPYYNCPQRILDKLTKVDDRLDLDEERMNQVAEWQAENQRRNDILRRATVGSTVVFAEPVTFANGAKVRRLTVEKRYGRHVKFAPIGRSRYKLGPGWTYLDVERIIYEDGSHWLPESGLEPVRALEWQEIPGLRLADHVHTALWAFYNGRRVGTVQGLGEGRHTFYLAFYLDGERVAGNNQTWSDRQAAMAEVARHFVLEPNAGQVDLTIEQIRAN